MSSKKRVTFFKLEKDLPAENGFLCRFHFKIVDCSLIGELDEVLGTEEHSIEVLLPTKLGKSWKDKGLKPEDFLKVLVVYAGHEIRKKLENGDDLKQVKELRLSAGDHPSKCPVDPLTVKDPNKAIFTVSIPEQKPEK